MIIVDYIQKIEIIKIKEAIFSKINIVFKTTGGLISNLTVYPDKTITDTLLIYLKRVNKTEYYKPNKDIFFLNNAKRIDVYDKRKIRELFGFNLGQIIIIVNDVKNLIGASYLKIWYNINRR